MVDLLLKLEPRSVEAEPPEPKVAFNEVWNTRTQDRGRCLISIIPKQTRIC